MSGQIEAGEGWRLLGPDEVIKKGDEVCPLFSFVWSEVPEQFIGKENQGSQIRRRIPAKPEAMEIDDPSGKMNVNVRDDGSVLVEQEWSGDFPDFVAIDTVDSIRKLSQWFAQVADWREAQEGESK